METRSPRRRTPGRTRRCESCNRLFAKVISSDADAAASTSPCRFCGHRSGDARTPYRFATVHLRLVFDEMPPADLQRIRLAVNAIHEPPTVERLQSAVAPISPPLASWIGLHEDRDVVGVRAAVVTVTDVLQTLIAATRRRPTPDQVNDIVVNVIEGRLDRLPIPPTGPCFCHRGRPYADCHGRRTA